MSRRFPVIHEEAEIARPLTGPYANIVAVKVGQRVVEADGGSLLYLTLDNSFDVYGLGRTSGKKEFLHRAHEGTKSHSKIQNIMEARL